jgi:hypothetical protein
MEHFMRRCFTARTTLVQSCVMLMFFAFGKSSRAGVAS